MRGVQKKKDRLFEDWPGRPDGQEGEEISAERVCELPSRPSVMIGGEEVDDEGRNYNSDGEDDVGEDVDIGSFKIDVLDFFGRLSPDVNFFIRIKTPFNTNLILSTFMMLMRNRILELISRTSFFVVNFFILMFVLVVIMAACDSVLMMPMGTVIMVVVLDVTMVVSRWTVMVLSWVVMMAAR